MPRDLLPSLRPTGLTDSRQGGDTEALVRGILSSFTREAEAQARFEATSQQARRHLCPSRLIVKDGAHNAVTAAAAKQCSPRQHAG